VTDGGSGLRLVLHSPRIALNVGAVGRLCAATGTELHVVRPIPFSLDERTLERSGLDYWSYVRLVVHTDWSGFLRTMGDGRAWLFTTRGTRAWDEARFRRGDALVFGNEPHGVTDEVRESIPQERHLKIPMLDPRARSLNMAMAAAVGIYEAIRQVRRDSD